MKYFGSISKVSNFEQTAGEIIGMIGGDSTCAR